MMRRQRRGAAAIEFVLTMSAGILLIFGMIELSRFQETGVMVASAAQDAVAAGAHILETSNPATGVAIKSAAESRATASLAAAGIDCSPGCVTTTTWTTIGGWRALEVSIEVSYQEISHLGILPSSLTRSAVTVTQQQEL